MAGSVFPETDWERRDPEALGMDAARLSGAGRWLQENSGDRPYRAVVVRGGYIAAEWYAGCEAHEQVRQASAGKSVFSCMLDIAVAEGVIGSVDDRVVDYYPEMMCVPEGFGPKPGRFSREKDREITFRQLISNTSGYLKPGEAPGKVFHYQTFGMNILCHAIATAYGFYDSRDPRRLGGFGKLIEEKIRDPIGGTWSWEYTNFDLPRTARINIFGNYTQLRASAHDMGRLGWLWCNSGRWGDKRIISESWMHEATKVAPDVRACAAESEWRYGYGFWTNELRKEWGSLPPDSFAAHGAGAKLVWVCPSLDLVVVKAPGLYEKKEDEDTGLLPRIVGACR